MTPARRRRRGAGLRRPRAAAALLAAAFAVGAAAVIIACGEPGTSDIAPLLGSWYRVEGGEPNPEFSLVVAEQDDGVAVTFTNRTNGKSETVNGVAEDGEVVCTMSTGDTGAGPTPGASPAPGVPARVRIRLSIDEVSRQLVVDLVLSDGTLEPIWIYDRGEITTATP